MKFVDLLAGQAVFNDTNIFVYFFRPDPLLAPSCDQLLRRIENQELQAFTSSHVPSEMVHRLMTDEASQRFGWPMTGIAHRLRSHPALVVAVMRDHGLTLLASHNADFDRVPGITRYAPA